MKKVRNKRLPPKGQHRIIILFILIVAAIGIFSLLKNVSNSRWDTNIANRNKKHLSALAKLPPPEIKKPATDSATLRVPILLYHYVEYVQDKKDTIRQSLTITPFIFDKQIETLKNAGYTFITPSTLADIIDKKIETPAKPIILSFDDGYMDFYTDVFPKLKKYNVKAVAYIVPGFLDKLNYMDSWQVEEVAKSGLVEIAAHTVHHAYLKKLSLERARFEISDSKTMLEQKFHVPVVSFAYPYGGFDEQAIQLVKHAAFKTAVTTLPGISVNGANRYFLFRLRPGGRIGETLIKYLEQDSFQLY